GQSTKGADRRFEAVRRAIPVRSNGSFRLGRFTVPACSSAVVLVDPNRLRFFKTNRKVPL
ncbi:MAG: hypothetical protein ACRDD1_01025, partial [Planctomycetia bacterium]